MTCQQDSEDALAIAPRRRHGPQWVGVLLVLLYLAAFVVAIESLWLVAFGAEGWR